MNKEEVVKILDEKVKEVCWDFCVKIDVDGDLCLGNKNQNVCYFRKFDFNGFNLCAVGRHLSCSVEKCLKVISVFYKGYEELCEEKFYVRMFEDVRSYLVSDYLNLDKRADKYLFGRNVEGRVYKTKFTNRDIEVMPDRIKKAISCGFLVKEEAYE